MFDLETLCPDDRSGKGRERLVRLAQTLGCSVRDFHDAPSNHPLGNAVEILRLWLDIVDEAGRQNVLACARRIVAAQGDTPKVVS